MSEEHYPRQAKVTVTSVSIPSWFEVAASDAMTRPRSRSRVGRYAPDQGFESRDPPPDRLPVAPGSNRNRCTLECRLNLNRARPRRAVPCSGVPGQSAAAANTTGRGAGERRLRFRRGDGRSGAKKTARRGERVHAPARPLFGRCRCGDRLDTCRRWQPAGAVSRLRARRAADGRRRAARRSSPPTPGTRAAPAAPRQRQRAAPAVAATIFRGRTDGDRRVDPVGAAARRVCRAAPSRRRTNGRDEAVARP